jgi:TetR/AcrR family transcriptional regulator, regulator of cefoperazone and chloramphenicol sensitivity
MPPRTPKIGGKTAPARGAADETKRRLLDAALDAFGRFGFDGASTREIARRAGVNLAAIPYHFGGKEGLQVAVARHIVDEITSRLGVVVDEADRMLEEGAVGPAEARVMLHAVLDNGAVMLLGHPEAARWAPFIIREQMQPSPAFDALYDGFMGRAHIAATRLFAIATGRDATAADTVTRVFALFGQLVIFRVGRAIVERRLGWTGYGPREIALVTAMLHDNLDAILDAEVRP